jgi:hypothetical protein
MVQVDEKVYIAHPLVSIARMLLAEEQGEVAVRLLGTVAFAHETNRTYPWNTERGRDQRSASLARSPLAKRDLMPNLLQVANYLSWRQYGRP